MKNLYMEANEAALKIRKDKLATQYYLKLKSCHLNPEHECTIDPKSKLLFNQNKNKIKTFGVWMDQIIEETNPLEKNT